MQASEQDRLRQQQEELCSHPQPTRITSTYLVDGVEFTDTYCGRCGKTLIPWKVKSHANQ